MLLQVASTSSRHKLVGTDRVLLDSQGKAKGKGKRKAALPHPAVVSPEPNVHAGLPVQTAEPAHGGDHLAEQAPGREDKGNEHGAHAQHEDTMSVAISATLTGAIIFVMALFYLLNHSHEHIRRYSYETVNTTISIFSGILLFQAINEIVEKYVIVGLNLQWKFVTNLSHMLCWLALLQLTLASFAGILGPKIYKPSSTKNMMLNIKCWSVLLAHITGFASLNAWGTLQQAAIFKHMQGMEFLIVPIAAVFLLVIERVTDTIREWVALRNDQHKDKYERAWDETTEDAENEVMGFTISFLTVQAARGLICGRMPSPSGEELAQTVSTHSGYEVMQLFGTAVLFLVLIVVVMHGRIAFGWKGRFPLAMVTATCMGFAWSIFFASLWYLGSFPFLASSIVLLSVVQAVGLSILSFATIFALDWLIERDWTGEEADKDIIQIIGGIGMLVGFSWEQCFHHATHALSHHANMPATGKLSLSIMCLLIIVPAWRFYMLPMVIEQGWRFGFVPEEATLRRALDHLKVAGENELAEES